MSVETYEEATSVRAQALQEREEEFDVLSAELVNLIEERGGEIYARSWTVGWLGASVDRDLLDLLAERADVSAITPEDVGHEQHISSTLGTFRTRAETDAQTYWDAGFNGENGGGSITIGVQEQWHFNDEACFFGDDSGCDTERLVGRWKCWDEYCTSYSQADYSESSNDLHGTLVTSVLAGDYTQDQAQGLFVCDSTTNHSDTTFEPQASGFAKEALVTYFDHQGTTGTTRHMRSAECMQGIDTELGTGPGSCYPVSIINSSNGWSSGGCTATSSNQLEDLYENVFDDGILIVTSAGNSGSGGSCNVNNPADIPKTFAVNGLTVNSSGYHSLPIDDDMAVAGGGDIQSPDGTNVAGALSMIDLSAASDQLTFVTSDTGTNGCVGSNFRGTSAAAPQVAGMAALVKDWGLNEATTWITNVGRLHTVMQAMGDRADSTGGRHVVGADDAFGFGRVKLRLLTWGQPSANPGSYNIQTQSFTGASPDFQYIAFDAPVPVGTDLVKCILMQDEDMSGKDNISRIDLEVRVRAKVGSNCVVGGGTVYGTRINADHDHKKMVAFKDADFNVENTCIEVTLDKEWVSSSGGVTVHALCLYLSETDDSP